MTEFKMPSLGADMEAGTLVEWRKKPGDLLQPGDIIAEVDTQKGLIEIEVFESGILEKYLIAEGDVVPVGSSMATIRPEGSAGETEEKAAERIHPIQEKEQTTEGKAPAPAEEVSEGKDVAAEEIHRKTSKRNLPQRNLPQRKLLKRNLPRKAKDQNISPCPKHSRKEQY
jgi:pyruvate dehydrogenase E2 component (dihydrolipoamide acetyltransferase)